MLKSDLWLVTQWTLCYHVQVLVFIFLGNWEGFPATLILLQDKVNKRYKVYKRKI